MLKRQVPKARRSSGIMPPLLFPLSKNDQGPDTEDLTDQKPQGLPQVCRQWESHGG